MILLYIFKDDEWTHILQVIVLQLKTYLVTTLFSHYLSLQPNSEDEESRGRMV